MHKIDWFRVDYAILNEEECEKYLIHIEYDVDDCKLRLDKLKLEREKGYEIDEFLCLRTERAYKALQTREKTIKFRLKELSKSCDNHRKCNNLHIVKINYSYYNYLKKFKLIVKHNHPELFKQIDSITLEQTGRIRNKKE